MKLLGILSAILSSFFFLSVLPASFGQNRGPQLVSPEVLPDHRITFRISAPKAAEVTLGGDWMATNTVEKLTKGDQGLWSVTLGPLLSGPDIYWFNVDGITMADPVNPKVKLRARTSASVVYSPSDTPMLWDPQDVPHGTVAINPEKSTVLGDTRSYYVYTPPGYEHGSTEKYPVLYLLHGSNDTAAGWTDIGKANFILDNLIAQKKAVPMIVVMPWGHAVPFDGPQTDNTAKFEQYLLQDVIPSVEKKYRVAAGRENRAIAGLSMGGGQTLQIGWDHLELFSSIAAFSFVVPRDFENRYKAALDDPTTNSKLNLLWLGVGSEDNMMYDNDRNYAAMLTAHKINNSIHETPGRHQFAVWRWCLCQVAPLLFQPNAKPAAGAQ